jgi:hypothetical protein
MFVYFDSETIKTTDASVVALLTAGVRHPATYKKPETIAAWEANERPAAIAEAVSKTSLDGAFGRVAVLGYAIEDSPVEAIFYQSKTFDEALLLQTFFSKVTTQLGGACAGNVTLVGHNITGFDIRFITQRAIVLGVRLPRWWPRNPKPWDANIFDTMVQWAGARDYVTLGKLCAALGIPTPKNDMDGSQVSAAWERGEFDRVADYCCDDVEAVRAVAKRMLSALEG